MAQRVAVGNNKGGSGKTAFVVGAAAALAGMDLRVLIVDMDPQANASRRVGFQWDPAAPVATVSEAIKADNAGVAGDAVAASGWDGIGDRVDVVPSRFDLENRISEAGTVGAAGRLRRALQGADDDYDVALIDCPPSLGHLTQMAFAAAHAAVCTVEPEYDSVEGAVRFRDFIAAHATDLANPDLRIAGYVVSRVRTQVGAHIYQAEGLADLLGAELVWEPHIPERAAVKDAADAAIPLRELGGSRAGELARCYEQLASRLADAVKVA